MNIIWTLVAIALVFAIFWIGARWIFGGYWSRRVTATGAREREERQFKPRDLGANINPSQHGNEADRWPDRTGARTRRELGARHAADVTFTGDREERKAVQEGPARAAVQPGVRREVQPGPHEHGPGSRAGADLAPEDQYGEDRPAVREIPPDRPPTQWHPREHGLPGDHYRDGHHRSATAPQRRSGTVDPYAHAPVPGPNHVPPETGQELPPNTQP